MCVLCVLTSFIGCTSIIGYIWWYKTRGGGEIESAVESLTAVAQKAAEAVSSATGRSVEEIKNLSKEDLEQFADAAACSADGISGDQKNSELIEQIRESALKLDLAFNALVAAGYSDDVVDLVLGNMSAALGKLGLAGKLAAIIESDRVGIHIVEEYRKTVWEFGGDISYMKSIENTRGYANAHANGIKACVKNLMGSVIDLFEKGVRDKLGPALRYAPYKFKDSLNKLWDAALSVGSASHKVKY
ncbi:hypothetical protein [Borrelia sp. RT1S]|uniref:hypothetical protein n=1 Tax=Borrelia sp. RT1S TaxID=2898580 RepID=UPI001E65C648|nr:hypothetical protein [Borrelia sp. RT1S]UGQ17931.1 hypothetical protein LSO05_05725 [Borrelia sp. RT1S]